MCGITGMVLGKKNRSGEDLEWLREKFCRLMVATEVRGTDATGAFIVNKSGIEYYKAPEPSSEVVLKPEWWGLMDKISDETLAVIGHTRFATEGNPEDNDNNHPICIDKIIGVHNGIIRNHQEMKDKYGSVSAPEVDSAAIFTTIAVKSGNRATNTDIIANSLEELEGDMAIVLADARRTDSIFVARDSGRPLVFTNNHHRKVLFMASTPEILEEGLGTEELAVYTLPNYTVARLSAGHGSGKAIKASRWFPKKKETTFKLSTSSSTPRLSFSKPRYCLHQKIEDLGLELPDGERIFLCRDCGESVFTDEVKP